MASTLADQSQVSRLKSRPPNEGIVHGEDWLGPNYVRNGNSVILWEMQPSEVSSTKNGSHVTTPLAFMAALY